jgi:hypothetical protein
MDSKAKSIASFIPKIETQKINDQQALADVLGDVIVSSNLSVVDKVQKKDETVPAESKTKKALAKIAQ